MSRLNNYEYNLITTKGNQIIIGTGQRAHIITDTDKVSRFRKSKKITVACEIISDFLVTRNQDYIQPAHDGDITCLRCKDALADVMNSVA